MSQRYQLHRDEDEEDVHQIRLRTLSPKMKDTRKIEAIIEDKQNWDTFYDESDNIDKLAMCSIDSLCFLKTTSMCSCYGAF